MIGQRRENTSTNISTAWTIAARGLLPPLRILVAVRAIAPVAAKPLKNGAKIFASPWPISSWLESCRVFAMPSAAVAESRDSIAPSNAMVNAGQSNSALNSEKSGSIKLRQLPRNAAERLTQRHHGFEYEK